MASARQNAGHMRSTRRTVGVLTASYNTREMTALLLWSLRRVLIRRPERIVVVDNASQDGSTELLSAAEAAGICSLVRNDANVGHGPALNQGIELLCAQGGIDWIWVLDSDCVIARPDAIETLEAGVGDEQPAVIGEAHWDPWLQRERFELYSLVLDCRTLCEGARPGFGTGGDPSIDLLDALHAEGVLSMAFPFTRDGHVIHRGRGSLAGVAERAEVDHPLYEWAQGHHDPHFGGVDGAAQRYESLVADFRREVGSDLATFIEAPT